MSAWNWNNNLPHGLGNFAQNMATAAQFLNNAQTNPTRMALLANPVAAATGCVPFNMSSQLGWPGAHLRAPHLPAASLHPPAASLHPPAASLHPPAASLHPPAASMHPPAPPALTAAPQQTVFSSNSATVIPTALCFTSGQPRHPTPLLPLPGSLPPQQSSLSHSNSNVSVSASSRDVTAAVRVEDQAVVSGHHETASSHCLSLLQQQQEISRLKKADEMFASQFVTWQDHFINWQQENRHSEDSGKKSYEAEMLQMRDNLLSRRHKLRCRLEEKIAALENRAPRAITPDNIANSGASVLSRDSAINNNNSSLQSAMSNDNRDVACRRYNSPSSGLLRPPLSARAPLLPPPTTATTTAREHLSHKQTHRQELAHRHYDMIHRDRGHQLDLQSRDSLFNSEGRVDGRRTAGQILNNSPDRTAVMSGSRDLDHEITRSLSRREDHSRRRDQDQDGGRLSSQSGRWRRSARDRSRSPVMRRFSPSPSSSSSRRGHISHDTADNSSAKQPVDNCPAQWRSQRNNSQHQGHPVTTSVRGESVKQDGGVGTARAALCVPLAPTITTMDASQLILPPGRKQRPGKMLVVMRGPPASGKTYTAKLLKNQEIAQKGSAPRILSLDDYFCVEEEKQVRSDNGKLVKQKVMKFEYDAGMEKTYRTALERSLRKTVDDGLFSFIILDCINDQLAHFMPMSDYASQRGFKVYVAEMDMDVSVCQQRLSKNSTSSINERGDLSRMVANWQKTPPHLTLLNLHSLLHGDSIQEVEMEDSSSVASANNNDAKHLATSDTAANDSTQDHTALSKWEMLDASEEKLDKLDGVSSARKRLDHHQHHHHHDDAVVTGTPQTIQDYLNSELSKKNRSSSKKQVRWADIEECNEQRKAREVGFVVGQTDWKRMTDPTFGQSALTSTKYI